MIDSHCHLNYIEKSGTPEQLIENAQNSGVHTILNIGTDIKSSQLSVDFAEKYNEVYAVVGVHPHDARTVTDDVIGKISDLAELKKVVAIGEIGLDYYRDLSPRKMQRKVFLQFLELAVNKKKPIVIHTREAFEDTLEIVKDYARHLPGGVFHCFPGNIDDALNVIDLGFVISVGGIITYKNSKMSAVAKETPLEKIIIETDAPFLTPVPYRGKTNQPAYVKYIYEKLADLKEINVVEVEKLVDRTCRKLFSLVEMFGD
ncbi:MAG: TatD family hydrolase [Candidatus Zixiibacteriota bacterium]